jgi:hypothetical protein
LGCIFSKNGTEAVMGISNRPFLPTLQIHIQKAPNRWITLCSMMQSEVIKCEVTQNQQEALCILAQLLLSC